MTRQLTLTEDQHHLLLSLVRSEQAVYSRHHVAGGLSDAESVREDHFARLADGLEAAEVVSSTTPDRGPVDQVLDDLRVYLAACDGRPITAALLADHLSKFYELYATSRGFRDNLEVRMAVLSKLFDTNLGRRTS